MGSICHAGFAERNFLHTRNFLNYHKKGKFEDISLEIYKKNKLVAVCPACLITEKKKRLSFLTWEAPLVGLF